MLKPLRNRCPTEFAPDQLQEETGAIEHLSLTEGSEAGGQPCFELQRGKKLLPQHKAREGGERLVFKFDLGQGMGFSSDIRSATFHGVDLLVCGNG
jgi:hypothetical protein